jgi:hypothetical protein
VRHNEIIGEPKRKWLVRFLTSQNPVKRLFFIPIKLFFSCLPRNVTKKFLNSIKRQLFVRTEMKEETRLQLRLAYEEEITQLESLINRDLNVWR